MIKHRVIIRDDDTCGLTPVPYLEQLYRPFLDLNLPVNLALIPEVATGTRMPDGGLEGFIRAGREVDAETMPVGEHREMVDYLKANQRYSVVQPGHRHDYFEFASKDGVELGRKLDVGADLLESAGLGRPRTFVAPYDQYSPVALREIAARFDVFSTGWFDRRRLPLLWLPGYVSKKLAKRRHWEVGGMKLLTHPGCLLSYKKDCATMFENVQRAVRGGELTVLVTHWWEYFDNHQPNRLFIAQLHKVAKWLAEDPEVEVVSFEDL